MGVNRDTLCLMTDQKKLKDKFKDTSVLPMINKSDMAGIMEAIKEYLRLHHGVVRAPLAYIMRKTIIVQTCGDYPTYAAHDDKMIAMMLHLPSDKNKVHSK